MKKVSSFIMISIMISTTAAAQGILGKLKDKVKNKTEQQAEKKTDEATTTTTTTTQTDQQTEERGTATATETPSVTTYQNYDFVPGDKILFEDHFTDDADGEFPAHWELVAGQAVMNKLSGQLAFFLTEGNYVRVKPRMKTEKYLSDPFSIEFDYYHLSGAYGLIAMMKHFDESCKCEGETSLQIGATFAELSGKVHFNKYYPPAWGSEENFSNKWHHIAIAEKNHQVKIYVDQNRILVVPDTKVDFYAMEFAGIGSDEKPLILKNVRIASGGDMNMIGKKFTEAKIITHGINFDVDKAVIRPESMGTLNMIVQVMKDNPEIKFEVDGHTDNTGAAAHNLALSQQRADAVKAQLITMGVDASRLSSKGFGDTKPMADNSSFEGKANNRRVEFVKM